MRSASSLRSWPVYRGKQAQRGQALIYGIFLLIGSLAALFFLFNTGQLSREKTKLVNASDAVAYSAGVMNARALNFHAYTNRAMVANTVAIAQLVSLSSWVQYVGTMADYGYVLQNSKFQPYQASYQFSQSYAEQYRRLDEDDGSLERTARISDNLIREGLMSAQRVVHLGLIASRMSVADQVANANYANDGSVTVQELLTTVPNYSNMVERYDGDDRRRFADVVNTAANRDGFVPRRSWDLPALWADCASASPRVDWLDRRGGTSLIGFDEWKSVDTLSEKRWVPRSKVDVLCTAVAETPAAWGYRSASNDPSFGVRPLDHDASLLVNPGPTGIAIASSSDAWGYSGLPAFYELNDRARDTAEPVLRYSVRVSRPIAQTMTSEGRAAIRNTPRLNAYRAQPAGGSDMVAMSSSEAFFSRQDGNSYGQGRGHPRELASLFNPFWQVRLVNPPETDFVAAWLLQGIQR